MLVQVLPYNIVKARTQDEAYGMGNKQTSGFKFMNNRRCGRVEAVSRLGFPRRESISGHLEYLPPRNTATYMMEIDVMLNAKPC